MFYILPLYIVPLLSVLFLQHKINAFQTEDFLLTGVFYYGIINKKIFH